MAHFEQIEVHQTYYIVMCIQLCSEYYGRIPRRTLTCAYSILHYALIQYLTCQNMKKKTLTLMEN